LGTSHHGSYLTLTNSISAFWDCGISQMSLAKGAAGAATYCPADYQADAAAYLKRYVPREFCD